ncbi:MAG: transglutaminase-like domain-containing protein [Planctomycetota bacterium]|jgi:hypothetical protein
MNLKKTLIPVLFAASLLLNQGCSTSRRRTDTRSAVPSQNNPDIKYEIDIAEYLAQNVEYAHDRIFSIIPWDFWSSPEKTLERGKGDCEDQAGVGAGLSEKLGYEPQVLEIDMGGWNYHLITLLHNKKTGKYGGIDQGIFYYPDFDSINSLLTSKYSHGKNEPLRYNVINLRRYPGDWRTTTEDLYKYRVRRWVKVEKDQR